MANQLITPDHDILITLVQKVDDLKTDVRDIKDNTTAKIAENTKDINDLKSQMDTVMAYVKIAGFVTGTIVAALVYIYIRSGAVGGK